MADNYLEKKMADYRAGRAGGTSRRPAGLRLQTVTVFLDNLAPELAAELCRVLSAVGYKVLATSTAGIAQGTGARLYPSGITPEALLTDLESRGEKLDCVISPSPSAFSAAAARKVFVMAEPGSFKPGSGEVVLVGGTPQQIALLAIALARPDSGIGQQIFYL